MRRTDHRYADIDPHTLHSSRKWRKMKSSVAPPLLLRPIMPLSTCSQARDVISNHPHFRGRADDFQFEQREGCLIIAGTVPTFYLKQLLQDALKQLHGVRQIDNRVTVVSPDGLSSVEPRV